MFVYKSQISFHVRGYKQKILDIIVLFILLKDFFFNLV